MHTLTRAWHVTFTGLLGSIRDHGLDNTRCLHQVWANDDDWNDGVYLWDTHTAAHDYATWLSAHIEPDGLGDPVVIEVDTTGLDLAPDTTGSTPVHGAWHTAHVPPHRLTIPDTEKSNP